MIAKQAKEDKKKRHWYRVPNKGKEGKSPPQPSKKSTKTNKKIYTGTGFLRKVKKAKTYYKPTPAQQRATKD